MRRSCLILIALLAALAIGPAGAAGIEVLRNQASSDFPDRLTFELEARSSSPITEVVLLYAMGPEGGLVEVRPNFNPGTEVSISYERDTQLYFLPTGVLLRYKWELRDESGARLETPYQQVRYEDQRFDWQELSEGMVTIRWYKGGADFGAALMQASQRSLDALLEQFGGQLSAPVRITIYANTRDMRAALEPNSAEWIGGQARPDLGLIIGAIAPGDESEIARLIPHELSHQVLHQTGTSLYRGPPPWFDEGLAVVNQEVRDVGFDEDVERAAREGRLISLRSLASGFPPDPEEALLSYAQSASIVRFIQQTYGDERFALLTRAFADGATPNEATTAALGLTIDQLDQAWRATLPPAEELRPTVTPALRAPASRFKVKTPSDLSDQVEEQQDASSDQSGDAQDQGPLAGIPLWIPLGLIALSLLFLLAGALIFRATRR